MNLTALRLYKWPSVFLLGLVGVMVGFATPSRASSAQKSSSTKTVSKAISAPANVEPPVQGRAAGGKASDDKASGNATRVQAKASRAKPVSGKVQAKGKSAPKSARVAPDKAKATASPVKGVTPVSVDPAALSALRKLGAMSVGLPHTGVLVNGVKMPSDPRWVITAPAHGYGTEETIEQLAHCIAAVDEEFPDSPKVMLGSLSAEQGGKIAPHKSHRTGRDVDVYFFRKPGAQWSKAATADDIDLPRTWALLRCFVTQTDVEMVLIERKVQIWIEAYARSIGEPDEWVDSLFYDEPRTKSAVVRHVPGHVAHMHVRFVSARARRLAQAHYAELVKTGLVRETVEEVRHRVVKGDTLLGLAQRYKTHVVDIQASNQLKGTVIRVGQSLLMQQGVPIEGVLAPIYAPGRWIPPSPCEPGPKACHAGLAVVRRDIQGSANPTSTIAVPSNGSPAL